VQDASLFHSFLANDNGYFDQGFHVVRTVKQRKFACEEKEQDRASGPNVNRWWHDISNTKSNHREWNKPPDCKPHLSNTSGARNPLVPARFALDCGLFLYKRAEKDWNITSTPSIVLRIPDPVRWPSTSIPRTLLRGLDYTGVYLVSALESTMRMLPRGHSVVALQIVLVIHPLDQRA